ncbi:MAG: hypothetical protein AB7G28_03850 [Pirellulales bacterium]
MQRWGKNVGAAAFFIICLSVVVNDTIAATLLPPTPYLSVANSPIGTAVNEYFYLENFEDGSLSTAGVTLSPGGIITAPSELTDSVDSDDGTIDGSGTLGRSLLTGGQTNTFSFQFDAVALGHLPTRAGIVWTDVGAVDGGPLGVGTVIFEAFGPANESLGMTVADMLGDGAITGATAEDRFFGAINPDGISRITITMPNSTDWEVDHLQYLRVPEPGGATLMFAYLTAIAGMRRPVSRR